MGAVATHSRIGHATPGTWTATLPPPRRAYAPPHARGEAEGAVVTPHEPTEEGAAGTRDRRTEDPSNFKRTPSEDDLGGTSEEVSGGRSNMLAAAVIVAGVLAGIALLLLLL